jgi:hypothetical protein
LKIGKEIQDLGLYGSVQCRCRFVGNDHPGLQDQGGRNTDPLPQTSTEFGWISSRILGRQGHAFHHLHDLAASDCWRADMMYIQWLLDALSHRLTRIQRRVGILKDYLDLPPKLQLLVMRRRSHIHASHPDRA